MKNYYLIRSQVKKVNIHNLLTDYQAKQWGLPNSSSSSKNDLERICNSTEVIGGYAIS